MREGFSRRSALARRAAIAIAAIALGAAAVFGAVRLWASPFALVRRAALHARRARTAAAADDFRQARREFRAALRLLPGDADARRQLAAMEGDRGNWELAFLELESLTQMHPERADAFIAAAELTIERGFIEAPEAALDKALEVEPQNADAHALRAQLRGRLGRFYGAAMDARAVIASAPQSGAAASAHETLAAIAAGTLFAAPPRHLRPDEQIDLGSLSAWTRERWPGRLGEKRRELDALLEKRRFSDADLLVESARRDFPDGPFAPYLAGVVELSRGNAEKAEREFSQALLDAPRSPAVAAGLARAAANDGGAAAAGQRLMRLAEADPGFAFARYLAARAYVETRDPAHAEGALRRGIALSPDSPVPYQHLADYDFGLDRAPEALAVCEEGLQRFPRDLALRMMSAQISSALGRLDEAARAYRAVLLERPDLDIVDYRLAMLLASQEKDERLWHEATQIGALLKDDRPSEPLLQDVLGWLAHRAGDDGRAEALLKSALQNAPGEPRFHFHLAAVHAAAGRRAQARDELGAAFASERPFPERLSALRLQRELGLSASRGE